MKMMHDRRQTRFVRSSIFHTIFHVPVYMVPIPFSNFRNSRHDVKITSDRVILENNLAKMLRDISYHVIEEIFEYIFQQ